MKKQYSKPGIIIENFEISQSIATGGCGVPGGGNSFGKPTHWTISTCGWYLDNVTTLWSSAPNCNEYVEDGEEVEGVCYNNPEGAISVFSS